MTKNQNTKATGPVALSPALRTRITKAVSDAKSASGNATYLQAVATGLVVEYRQIGEGGLYRTQGDYAAAIGTSNSNVSRLKNISRVIALGMGADHADFTTVCTYAHVGAMTTMLNGPRPSVAKAVKVAKAAAKDNSGKRADKAATPRKDAATKAADKAAGEVKEVAVTLTPTQRVQAALQVLSSEAKNLSDEEWTEVGKALATIVKRERTIRTKTATATKVA